VRNFCWRPTVTLQAGLVCMTLFHRFAFALRSAAGMRSSSAASVCRATLVAASF
jgi:hypothetical protein